MAAWLTEVLNPFAGPIGAPSFRCLAAGAAIAGYAAWRQRRARTSSGGTGEPAVVPRREDRPVASVAGHDR